MLVVDRRLHHLARSTVRSASSQQQGQRHPQCSSLVHIRLANRSWTCLTPSERSELDIHSLASSSDALYSVLPASITSAALLTGVYIAQIHGKAALRPQYDRLAREDKLPSTKAEEKIIEEEERKQHGNGDDDAPIRSEVWRTASSTVLAAALAILEVVQAIARHSRSSTWPWNIALAVSWVRELVHDQVRSHLAQVITASLFAAQAKRARLGKPASYELSTVLTTLLYAFAAIVDLRSAYLHHLPSHLNAAIASIACALLCIELISPRNSSPSAIGARPPSTIANASLLSRWTFFHIERLLYRNLRHPIEPSSVPDLLPEDKAASTLLQFRADVAELSSWRIFRGQRPSLQTQILYHVRGHLLRQALWAFVESFTSFAPALVLRQIVLFLERRARGEIAGSSEAIMWAVLLVGLQMADSLSGVRSTFPLREDLSSIARIVSSAHHRSTSFHPRRASALPLPRPGSDRLAAAHRRRRDLRQSLATCRQRRYILHRRRGVKPTSSHHDGQAAEPAFSRRIACSRGPRLRPEHLSSRCASPLRLRYLLRSGTQASSVSSLPSGCSTA